jgi:hypothetical protein
MKGKVIFMKRITLIISLIIFSLTFTTISYASENIETPLKEKYTQEELDYFYKIALSLEYGNKSNVIHKWNQPEITVSIVGNPAEEYINQLDNAIYNLNYILGDTKLKVVDKNGDLKIYFINHSNFHTYISDKDMAEQNWGYFDVWWNNNNEIYKGNIFIAIDKGSMQLQSHLIKEELTQSLGLTNDSYKYENSIFYQGWGDTPKYLDIDRSIIKLLYEPDIKSGMTKSEIQKLFK